MIAPELVEILLPMSGVCWRLPLDSPRAAATVVDALLGDVPLSEASVHLPRRGKTWVASFTGPNGGQIWKSTGLTDHDQALVLARRLEAEARAQRLSLGRSPRKPILRVRRQEPGTTRWGLTQREVAMLLNMSERAVRETECRAFQKLRQHPLLRQVWQQYLAGELDEHQHLLNRQEIQALFNLAHTSQERGLIRKILRLIRR